MNQREFIHALNNRLAVAYGNGKLVMKGLDRELNENSVEAMRLKVQKLLTALEDITELVKTQADELRRSPETPKVS